MNKVILLVFCHLVGDYVLQNDFLNNVMFTFRNEFKLI